MPSRSVDVIVLGAGMVGVSAALALQARGPAVVLVDRHGEAADETSYGNAGLVQSEAVIPYLFPRDPAADRQRRAEPRSARPYPLRRDAGERTPVLAYFQFSQLVRAGKTATAKLGALVFGAAEEHRRLAAAAGASDLLRPTDGSRSGAPRAAKRPRTKKSRS